MNYYSYNEERFLLIAGLRDLADFLDQNPDFPFPFVSYILFFPIYSIYS